MSRIVIILFYTLLISTFSIGQSTEYQKLNIEGFITLDFPSTVEIQDTHIQKQVGFKEEKFHQKTYTFYSDYEVLTFMVLTTENVLSASNMEDLKESYNELQAGYLEHIPNTSILSEEFIMIDSLLAKKIKVTGSLQGIELEVETFLLSANNKVYTLQNAFSKEDEENLSINFDTLVNSIEINNNGSYSQIKEASSREGPAYKIGQWTGRLILVALFIYFAFIRKSKK